MASAQTIREFFVKTSSPPVNSTDLGQVRATFNANNTQGNYIAFLDANNDGVFDSTDLGQFRVRFNANVF